MQKLEEFLYDFIGVFIPGFFMLSSLWLTTVTVIKIEVFNVLYKWMPFHYVLLSRPEYPGIKAVISQKGLMILMLIMVCYITGLLLTSVSAKLVRKKKLRGDMEMVFKENKKLQYKVEAKLRAEQQIKLQHKDLRNRWIIFYRWANIKSQSREEKSSLMILLSKVILNRSLFYVFKILALYTAFLLILSALIQFFYFRNSELIYYLMVLVYIIFCCMMSKFFLKGYRETRLKLSNEAVLILSRI
ncbi:hypothetical protein [Paenibacillus sp. DCT19]|uniref:hypothetical protein n=1 Tax=Paenibacillus sp. DCT19 TaxID=2211212 RepID=UPI000FE19688|nr:hypothetical protein [Paenibacillus sp. DCT19]